jgi:protein associated with RNAse G/E
MLNHVHVCSTHSNSLQILEFDEYKTSLEQMHWANHVRNVITCSRNNIHNVTIKANPILAPY